MFKERYHNVWLPKLLSEPREGKELTGPLSGIRSYHFKTGKVQYRIAYVLEENDFIINVLMIAKRESFYQILSKRIK